MSNQLQHRLLQFEVEPPAATWDAISDALDEQTTPAAEKLRAFEAAPAPRLWQQIESGLEGADDDAAPAIPFYRRYAKALRYGSAAAVLLLVALTITFLVNNNSNTSKVAQQSATVQPSRQTPRTAPPEATVRASDEPNGAQEHYQRTAPGHQAERGTLTSPTDETAVAKADPRPASGRYMTVANETGKAVRLSKKVYPVFDCAEHSSALERFQCQENIEALQKMASSLASPSGDFASLIDMIKTLEENR